MTGVRFTEALAQAFADGRRLCAGIDPHASVLEEWGLPDNALSAEFLAREMIAAAHGLVACVKPQVAFFERFGSKGYAALERVIAEAREAELLVIADVKRGDIGTSFNAYADTWLRPGSPLEADAMTVNPYQGFGTLSGALTYVREHGKGLFVLAATSNPEAKDVQLARLSSGQTLASSIVAFADEINHGLPADRPSHTVNVGGVGVVVGATLVPSEFGIPTDSPSTSGAPILPVLAPGFGYQGAKVQDAKRMFGALSPGLIVSESRSLMGRGNRGISKRIRTSAEAIAQAYAEADDE